MPNPDGGRFVGVDFEARNLMATVVDFSQQPLRQVHKTLRPTDSAAQILAKIEQAIDEMMAGDARPVLGIGVGVPGTIDPVTNVAVHYDFIKGWSDVPLGARLSERFGVPVFLENNIRSMALAELWFGAGRGLRNFVCIGIRSGIAAGVVVNGHLLHGAQHRAGEIGHWVCPVPAELADAAAHAATANGCGRLARDWNRWRRCPPSWPRRSAVGTQTKTTLAAVEGELTIDDVLAAARDGDEFAMSLVRAVGRVHGWVAHQLNELFDPEKIIFAGPLADLGDLFLATVRETARELGDAGRDLVIANSDARPIQRRGRRSGAGAAPMETETMNTPTWLSNCQPPSRSATAACSGFCKSPLRMELVRCWWPIATWCGCRSHDGVRRLRGDREHGRVGAVHRGLCRFVGGRSAVCALHVAAGGGAGVLLHGAGGEPLLGVRGPPPRRVALGAQFAPWRPAGRAHRRVRPQAFARPSHRRRHQRHHAVVWDLVFGARPREVSSPSADRTSDWSAERRAGRRHLRVRSAGGNLWLGTRVGERRLPQLTASLLPLSSFCCCRELHRARHGEQSPAAAVGRRVAAGVGRRTTWECG